ncbi:hypothetical protein ACIP5Y_23395 [Nocardia sp. NPDC088792]|uniref:hypothetical protein n=1 Tax=Nocardia sp. NPDC088792 TaxID=3364332 RepID=UPI0037FA8174
MERSSRTPRQRAPAAAHPPGSFARLLNTAIAAWEVRHGEPLPSQQLATLLAAGGHGISHGYLAQLRSGTRADPSARLRTALAIALEVPADYFLHPPGAAGPAPRSDAQLAAEFQQQPLRSLVCAAAGLSEQTLTELATLADHMRRSENLLFDSFQDYRPISDEHRPRW